jgi:hypothetical protein
MGECGSGRVDRRGLDLDPRRNGARHPMMSNESPKESGADRRNRGRGTRDGGLWTLDETLDTSRADPGS